MKAEPEKQLLSLLSDSGLAASVVEGKELTDSLPASHGSLIPPTDTPRRMRLAALILLVFALSATAATGAAKAPGGALEIKGGRGGVQITGKGVLVGRIEKGSLKITDLTPNDQWSPYVNGVPRGKEVWLRGENIGFRVSKGRYKIVARGDGISISAYGTGTAVLDGDPDAVGATGVYRVGDAALAPLPLEATKASFGTGDGSAPSSQSVKIQP